MKKNIIVGLVLTTLLVSGCSVPFLSKKTETVKCKMNFIGKTEAIGTFEDDKLVKFTTTQSIDISNSTVEEKEQVRQYLTSGVEQMEGIEDKIEEKDGNMIRTTIYDVEKISDKALSDDIGTDVTKMSKDEFKAYLEDFSFVCE